MDVSIIIVNYNTYGLLKECIKSIELYTSEIDFEIIVVDNNSPQRDIEHILIDFPSVKLIKYQYNAGFGIANNVGANKSKGDYLFFLNPDTLLLNNAVELFFDFMETERRSLKIGAVGGLLLDRNESINASYSEVFGRFDKDIVHGINRFLRKGNKVRNLDFKGLFKKVSWVSGAALFISKSDFVTAGGFDENIFMYFEDEDLQRRLMASGLSNYVIKGPKMIHLEGGGDEYVSLKKKKIIDTSKIYFFNKYRSSKFLFKVYFYFYNCLVFCNNLKRYGYKESIQYYKYLKSIKP